MLHRPGNTELPPGALDAQSALLPRCSPEHVPYLSHRRFLDRNAVNRDEMIAGLNPIHRRFALEVGNAEDGESPVVLRSQRESDDIEVRKIKHPAKLEVNRRMRIVEPNSVVEQCVRSQ